MMGYLRIHPAQATEQAKHKVQLGRGKWNVRHDVTLIQTV